jgi:hypothetical protein
MGVCRMAIKKTSIVIRHTPTIEWWLKVFDHHKKGCVIWFSRALDEGSPKTYDMPPFLMTKKIWLPLESGG